MVLIRPVFGEPRIAQATPATSGGANSGRMLAAAMNPLNGVLVRTTIQENASPITTAISGAAAAGDQRVDQRLGDVGVGQHDEEIGDRQMAETETVDHRIGVGQRAQQQREQRIDHQKAEDRQQQRDPGAGPHAPTHALAAAARRLRCAGPPVRSKRFSPWPAIVRFRILQPLGAKPESIATGGRSRSQQPEMPRHRRISHEPHNSLISRRPSHTHHATRACGMRLRT